MKICRYCGTQWEDGDSCPNCRMDVQYSGQFAAQQNDTKSSSLWIVLALVGGFVLLVAAAVCVLLVSVWSTFNKVNVEHMPVTPGFIEESRESVETLPVDPEAEREGNLAFQREKGIFVAGDYEIGKDIPAGEYLAVSNGNTPTRDFYLGVYTSPTHSDESELMGGWCQGSKYVMLEEGQYIELIHANLYDVTKHENPSNPFKISGMYRVGSDLEAGTYTICNNSDQYTGHYTIYSSINCIAPITRDAGMVSTGETVQVTLQEGEYIEMKFCCLQQE